MPVTWSALFSRGTLSEYLPRLNFTAASSMKASQAGTHLSLLYSVLILTPVSLITSSLVDFGQELIILFTLRVLMD